MPRLGRPPRPEPATQSRSTSPFALLRPMDSGFRIPVMIKNPKPTKVFRIGDLRNRNATIRWSSWAGETNHQPTLKVAAPERSGV
jgi:hypothetical protein